MKSVETYKCEDCSHEWGEPYALFMPPSCSNCGEHLNVVETTQKAT